MDIRELRQDTITVADADELARLQTLISPRRLRSDPPVTRQLAIDNLRSSGETQTYDYWGLFDDGVMVGLAESAGTLDGANADVCEAGIWVDPGRLGEKLHQVLFEHIKRFESDRGRTRFRGWGTLDDEPTRRFWQGALGYTLAFDGRTSRCSLADVDDSVMQRWIDQAAQRASGYRLEFATSPLPDELLDHYALALDAMNDAPHDKIEIEREMFGRDRAREVDSLHLATPCECRSIFAIETATGAFAGYTGVSVPNAEPALSIQLHTATNAAHRNRGIGRWMKAEMWKRLRVERPDVESLDTSNAESNRAMLAINEAMGFYEVTHFGVWHKQQ